MKEYTFEEDSEKEIKNFFLHCAPGMIFQLKR